jgi:cell wall-associated NlpC family hydrolase
MAPDTRLRRARLPHAQKVGDSARVFVAFAGIVTLALVTATAARAQAADSVPRFTTPEAAEAIAKTYYDRGNVTEARRIVAVATAYRWAEAATPYHYGAIGTNGIDCSALVRAAYLRAGLTNVPRTSHELATRGRAVSRAIPTLEPADLLVFGKAGAISHVGMYLGGGYFIHAASSEHGVVISRLDDPKWTRLWISARRLIEDAPPSTSGSR